MSESKENKHSLKHIKQEAITKLTSGTEGSYVANYVYDNCSNSHSARTLISEVRGELLDMHPVSIASISCDQNEVVRNLTKYVKAISNNDLKKI